MIDRQRTVKRTVLAGALIVGALVIVAVLIVRAVDSGPEPQAAPSASTSSQAPPNSTQSPAPTSSADKKTPVPSPSLGTPSSLGSGAPEPVDPVKTKKPVALDKTGDFGTGLTVRLSDLAAVEGEATVPGEISGPAIKVTVKARNRADRAVDLNTVLVFFSYGPDQTPASELKDGARPLKGRIASDDTKTGTYIYSVPEDEREKVRVEISYSGKAPTVAFEGPVEG